MKTKSIKQTVTFNASPELIYNLIMDEKKHAAFTGSKAIIDSKAKGKFSVFDGYCHGYNMELLKGKKIVQAWHFAEDGWQMIISAFAASSLKRMGQRQNSDSCRQMFPNIKSRH